METMRVKHPALSFLVSLSVAGTCLAVPGLALADTATADNGSPSDNAAEVVEAAKPLDAAEKAEVGIADTTTDDSAAADAGAQDKGNAQAPDKGAKDGMRGGKGAAVTKDIKVDGSTVTFAGVSVDVPDSFRVMGIHHAMAVAVSPTGEMSVTIGAPDMRGLKAYGGAADLGYFDTIAAALAQSAGIGVPAAEEVHLADNVTAYKYVFQLAETDDGRTELDEQVTLVFVPVGDSYALVQITVDEDVVSVSNETVDAIISSIRVAPADAAAAEKADAGDKAAATDKADANQDATLSEAEKAATDADKADTEARAEVEKDQATDADKAAESQDAAKADDAGETKADDASKAGDAAVADEKDQAAEGDKAAADKADSAAGALKDGTYTAEGKGIGGTVPVTVVVKDGKISEVTVGDNSETEGIGSKAIEQLPALIVEANGTEGVDGVSGATITSGAIFTAVDDAVAQASAGDAATADDASKVDAADGNAAVADEKNDAATTDAKADDTTDADKAADATTDAASKAGNAAVADEKNDAAETKADDASKTDDAATTDAGASPTADAAGTTETVAGMTFVLPEGLTVGDTSTDDRPVWSDADKNFVVTVKPAVNDNVAELTLDDLDAAALDLAASMNGEVIGYAVFDNDTTTVYMYAIVFHEGGEAYVGTVGFIPVADNTLNALTGMFKLDEMETYAPVIEAMYESVSVD